VRSQRAAFRIIAGGKNNMNYGAHTGHAHHPQVSTYGHPSHAQVLTPGPMTYRGPEDSLAPMSVADRTLHSTRIEVPVETQGARSVRSAVFMVSGFLIGVAVCVLVMRQAMHVQEPSANSLAAALPAAAEGLPPPKAAPAAVPTSRDLDMELPEADPAAKPAAPRAKVPPSPKTTRTPSPPTNKTASAPPVAPKVKAAPPPKYPTGSNKAEQDLMRQAFAATASAL